MRNMRCQKLFQTKQLPDILFSTFFWENKNYFHPKCFNSSLSGCLKACLFPLVTKVFTIQFIFLTTKCWLQHEVTNNSWLHGGQKRVTGELCSSFWRELWTHLHCSLELCLRRGERSPWAFPSCKFSFLFVLEGGWLNVWARLRNCGEPESSSGNVCQAEDSGEAGGVPGGESPGERSWNARSQAFPSYTDHGRPAHRVPLLPPESRQTVVAFFCFLFFVFTQSMLRADHCHHNPCLLISSCKTASVKVGQKVKGIIRRGMLSPNPLW